MLRIRWDMRLTDREFIRCVHGLDTPHSVDQIAELLGCHRNTVLKCIKRLNGIVIPVGVGRGIPYTYQIVYELLPDDLRTELGHNGNRNHANPI